MGVVVRRYIHNDIDILIILLIPTPLVLYSSSLQQHIPILQVSAQRLHMCVHIIIIILLHNCSDLTPNNKIIMTTSNARVL